MAKIQALLIEGADHCNNILAYHYASILATTSRRILSILRLGYRFKNINMILLILCLKPCRGSTVPG